MIILLELDQQLNNSQWNNAAGITDGVTTLSPGIWRYKTTIGNVSFNADYNDDYAKTDDPFNNIKLQVGSFVVDNTDYTLVDDFTDLESQNESFNWDATAQTIYVHFDGLYPPYVFTTKNSGYVLGFCRTPQNSGYSTETGVFYSPALKKAPVIRETADALFYGIIQNPYISAELSNSSKNSLDDIAKRILIGNPCRMKIGEDTDLYEDFVTTFSGRVKNIPSITEDIVKLQLQTDRAFLSKKLPFETYDQTTYPNISDDDVGKPVPLIFGVVRGTPCINLDFATSPTNYTYKICTVNLNGTAYYPTSVQAVYADGIEITPASTANFTTDGTIELVGTDILDGTSFFEITADVTGYSNDNALEIIRVIADEFLDKEYIAANYNLEEWGDAESNVIDVGLVIGASQKETFLSVIENICGTVQGNFKIQGDGKYTFRFQDEDRFPIALIDTLEELQRPSFTQDDKEYLSSATCEYSRNWSTGVFRKYEDTSLEDEVISNYRIAKEKPFKTLITTEDDAIAFSEARMEKSSTVPPRFPQSVALDRFKHLELFDNVYLMCDRIDREFYGLIRGVITDIVKDYNFNKLTIEVKWKADATIEDGVITSDYIILDGGYGPYETVLEYGELEDKRNIVFEGAIDE